MFVMSYNYPMALDPIRKIYSKKYYQAKQLLLDKRFQEGISKLKNKFLSIDCPIPQGGFKKYQELLDWNVRYGDAYSKLIKSDEYKNNIQRITGGKENINREEYLAKEEFEKEFLPIPYGYYLEDIVEDCDFDPKDKELCEFAENYLFFNQEDLTTSLFNLIWRRNEKTDKFELFIQILGDTRKEDIDSQWKEIQKEQKLLPDYKERNKPWETFERDNKIYEKYLFLVQKRNGKRSRTKKGEIALDDALYREFSCKYPELELSNIREIITKVKKLRAGSKEVA